MIGQFSFYDKQKLTFDHYFNFGCLSQNQNSTLPWIVRRANAEVGPSGLPLYSAKLKAKFVKKEGGGDFFLKKKIIILKLAGRHLITKVSNLYLKCVHSARAANRD